MGPGLLLSAWDGGWVSPFLWRRCSCGQRLCPCRPSWPSSLGGLHCSIAAYVGCVRPERPSPFRGARSPCSAAPGRPEVQTHPQGGTRGTRGFPAPSVAKDRHLQLLPPRGGPRTHLVSGWARRVSRDEGGVRTRVLAHVLEGSSVSPSEESSHREEALPASLREGARFCGSGRCTEALPPDWSWCGCPGVSSPSQWLGRGRGGPRAWVSRTSGTVSAGAPGSARARLSWGAGDDTGSTHGEAGLGRGDTSWVPHASPGPPLTPPVTAGTSPCAVDQLHPAVPPPWQGFPRPGMEPPGEGPPAVKPDRVPWEALLPSAPQVGLGASGSTGCHGLPGQPQGWAISGHLLWFPLRPVPPPPPHPQPSVGHVPK